MPDVVTALPRIAAARLPAGYTLMLWGAHPFGLNTAALAMLSRSSEYRWAAPASIGRRPALQWIGPGPDAIRLRGVVLPLYRGRLDVLDDLRRAAEAGETGRIVSGAGRVYGIYALKRIDAEEDALLQDGRPRRMRWTIEMHKSADSAPAGYLEGLAG